MTNDNSRDGDGHSGIWSRLKTLSSWRLIEATVAVGFLYWLFDSTMRPDRASLPDATSRPVASAPIRPAPAGGPAFSDSRALVPGTSNVAPASPPSKVATPVAAPPPIVAAPPPRVTEPVAKAPSTEPPAIPARQPNIAANIPPPPMAQPVPAKADATCPPPEIHVTPLPAGQTQIRIESPCRRGQDVGLAYDGVEFKRQLPTQGPGLFTLDLFAGDRRSVDVTFADGSRRVIPVVTTDLDKVSKVAVRWRAPVNLDLHVFEHAARAGQPGHVWTGATASPESAVKTRTASGLGRGFLTTYEDGQGDKVEVYTYVHGDKDTGTTVAMALDHETRGSQPIDATCGQGPLAKVEFAITMLSPKGEIARAAGTFKPARCNQPLAAADRFDYALMPTITVRN